MRNGCEHSILTSGRRDFLKQLSIGAAAAVGLGAPATGRAALFSGQDSRVALVKSNDHREAAYQSLRPFKDEVEKAIGDRKVVVKVNAGLLDKKYTYYTSHVDQIRGILDFVREVYDGEIVIAEGCASDAKSAFIGFENFGYLPLEKEYKNVALKDANLTPFTTQWIRAAKYHPTPIDIIDLYHDPDVYLISAARMKTHNCVVGTFSLKNVGMGSPVCHWKNTNIPIGQRNEKSKMHGGEGSSGGRELSWNLFQLAMLGVRPDLAAIDGVEAIEGDGPWDGEVVEHNIGIGSTDFVAADMLCAALMGIDTRLMKYIQWCGDAGMGTADLSKVKILGPDYKDLVIKYNMNKNFDWQVQWIYENFDMNG